MTIAIPNSTDLDALALARRSGWPEDLRVLVARYPREQWDTHPNLGEMARFWLSRHAMFRELSSAIEQIAGHFRTGKLAPEEFARHFVPRLKRHGVGEEAIRTMLVDNPRRVFGAA